MVGNQVYRLNIAASTHIRSTSHGACRNGLWRRTGGRCWTELAKENQTDAADPRGGTCFAVERCDLRQQQPNLQIGSSPGQITVILSLMLRAAEHHDDQRLSGSCQLSFRVASDSLTMALS